MIDGWSYEKAADIEDSNARAKMYNVYFQHQGHSADLKMFAATFNVLNINNYY